MEPNLLGWASSAFCHVSGTVFGARACLVGCGERRVCSERVEEDEKFRRQVVAMPLEEDFGGSLDQVRHVHIRRHGALWGE